MSPEEQDRLTEDIEQHGQRDPITVYEGMVLDGWHRYQACMMLEIEPVMCLLEDDADPVAFVISHNLHRRHLTGSQRAAAIVACSEWATVGKPIRNGEVTSPLATVPEMAKQAEVSERTIQQAKRATEAGLSDKVISGELSVSKAAEQAKPPVPKPEPPPVPEEEEDGGMVTISQAVLDAQNSLLDEMMAESVAFEKIVDADDKLAEAVATVKMQISQIAALKSQLEGANNKSNELIGMVKSLKRQVAALERDNQQLRISALPV
jgi:ParB-like chromosome segregation protein Spo0J